MSDNNYSVSERSKLVGIVAGAEVNVQAGQIVIDTGFDAYMKGKSTSMPADGGNAATVGGYTVAVDVPAGTVFIDTKPVTMKGAAASAVGVVGYAPSPAAGVQGKHLHGDGTRQTPPNATYPAATQSINGLMVAADKKKFDGLQEAVNYALKTDIAGVYHYKGSAANKAALPTTSISVDDACSIEAKPSYGPAGVNVAWTSDKTRDNLGGNFTIDSATVAKVSAILNAQEGVQDMKALSIDIIAAIRDWTKAYVNNNRFDTTYLQVDVLTGHLRAHQDANLKFMLLSDRYLKSEMI